ncbi:hypothetical protein RA178_06280 [Shewanella oncorhynchi]|uniref:Uncharacterized protein n=1 Tax=Shewanella oncorhynchi TaxID=2726434 RepID=A0AA50KFF7_9GAMM|nr:hypothetical protein [Shewanella oncorhynchi]WMB74219.1 hypothetical protein RA178_06280 [Shewanella oncorhynchi]
MSRQMKHVKGLDSVDKLLDSLTDPKFRKAALRSAARKAMAPVKEALQSNIRSSVSNSDTSSYEHYTSSKGKQGYSSGDLEKGVKLSISVNTDKNIKIKSNGFATDKQSGELFANVTFDNHTAKLAAILENGRTKRVATTRNGKVFHYFGNPTDLVQRDISTTSGKHFVSNTFAEQEHLMVDRFKKELITAIATQTKKMEKATK